LALQLSLSENSDTLVDVDKMKKRGAGLDELSSRDSSRLARKEERPAIIMGIRAGGERGTRELSEPIILIRITVVQ
jgi:hypothetical protein